MATQGQEGPQTVKVPFVMNNTEGIDTTKGQKVVNGFFEALANPITGEKELFLIQRPGLETLMTPATGVGRGCHFWTQTGKLYSVIANKIYSNTTDLGVTMNTSSGIVSFAETRPGVSIKYLGINDGRDLFLIGTDDTVVVLNNVAITSSSVANPTHIITASAHHLTTGNKIIIRNHTGSTPSLNDQVFTVTVINSTEFTIPVNVTTGGTGGTIGVFPSPNVGDLQYMDGYWFVMKSDATISNCAVDDPTLWPTTANISAIMLPGIGIGLGKQNNVLIGFTDRHTQMFYDAANPAPLSPLANIEQAMQQIGCVSSSSIASNENTTYWISNTETGGLSVYRLDGTSNLRDIGTPQVRRSITKNAFSIVGPNSPVQIVLASGTTWTVPADFNTTNNTIEAIGGGGGGATSTAAGTGTGGGGGGGGAYAKISNFTPGGATVSYTIGQGGATDTDGTDTTFNTASLVAKAGKKGTAPTGGAGGLASGSTGTIKRDGGTGGNGNTTNGWLLNCGGGGGGGAAGKFAIGGNGTNGGLDSFGSGGQGDGLLGGLGGVGSGGGSTPGNPGAEWGSAGSGGGGAGAPFTVGTSGGLYGAGGGGGTHDNTDEAAGGVGTNGVIVITYTPSSPSVNSTLSAYILRINGHIYYIVNLFSQNETWVYDQDLDLWVKWLDTTGTGFWPIIKTSQFASSQQPFSIVGQDFSTGTLFTVSNDITQDNGTNYTMFVTSIPIDFGTRRRKFWRRVNLVGDVETVSSPITVSYSDDDQQTFVGNRTLDMSTQMPFAIGYGQSRRRIWKFSKTSNIKFRASGFELEYEEGTD